MADLSDVNATGANQTIDAEIDTEEERLFADALDLEHPGERAAYLAAACGGDAALRGRIEQLLASYDGAGDFLESAAHRLIEGDTVAWGAGGQGGLPGGGLPAGGMPVGGMPVPAADERGEAGQPGRPRRPPLEGPGAVVGPYALLEKLGEGGMGVVYLAEQQRPVRRQVALKIIRPGMDSEQVLARFDVERQSLALMDHSNIARVLEAGATDAGRPYFVMELVRGVPITAYCDQHRLTPRQRLELFLPVCHAVQHAHTKGVIHRDIKPGNVLVARVEDRAVPKVIDFGVAKATQSHAAERTMFTQLGAIVGTPEYMSPEQADPGGVGLLGVDARSDVYSLGVLLYELLTGTTPLEAGRLREAGWEGMLRLIREAEPPRPSTRLSGTAGADRAGISARRSTDFRRLERLVAGDLDVVVMKALEKDRGRRYETANGLARDIERYLADEPVEAQPPSRGYRVRKLARRHRAALRVAAGFAALLAGASVVSTWQAVRATRAEGAAKADRDRAVAAEAAARLQRDVAVAESARATTEDSVSRAVTRFLTEDVIGNASALGQATRGWTAEPDMTVRQALDRAAARVGAQFADRPREETSIRQAIGKAYFNLGLYENARDHLEAAHALAPLPVDGTSPPLAAGLIGRAGYSLSDALRVAGSLAGAYMQLGRYDEAEPLFRRALQASRAALGPGNVDSLTAANNLAGLLARRGAFPEAATLYEQTLEAQRGASGGRDPNAIGTASNLALLYSEMGRGAEAERMFRAALEQAQRALGPDDPRTMFLKDNLASACSERGADDEAERLYRGVLADRTRLLGRGHADTVTTLSNLSVLYERQGRPEAAAMTLVAWELQRTALGDEHPGTLVAANNLAMSWSKRGQYAAAARLLEQTLATQRRTLGHLHADTLTTLTNLAGVRLAQRRWDEAQALLEQAMRDRQKALGPGHPDLLLIEGRLAAIQRDRGNYVEARAISARALAESRRLLGDNHRQTRVATSNLADIEARSGRFEAAVPLWTRVVNPAGESDDTARSAMLRLSLAQAARAAEIAYRDAASESTPAQAIDARLAWCAALSKAGAHDDALREAWIIAETDVAGVGIRQRLEARRQMALSLKSRGSGDAASGAYESLLPDARRHLGDADPLTVQVARDFLQFSAHFGRFDRHLMEPVVRVLGGSGGANAGPPLSDVGHALLDLGDDGTAEFVLREAIALLEIRHGDLWITHLARSRLGGSLAGQGRRQEAEALLLAGYKGIAATERQIEKRDQRAVGEALERLALFYNAEDSGNEQARHWRDQLLTWCESRMAPTEKPTTAPASTQATRPTPRE